MGGYPLLHREFKFVMGYRKRSQKVCVCVCASDKLLISFIGVIFWFIDSGLSSRLM